MSYWKSQVPGILLPAIPQAQSATLMSIQFQLELSQWYTPDRIAALQLKQLGLLLAHARTQSPFYAKRLAGMFTAARPVTARQMQQIQPLARRDLQQSLEEIRCRKYPDAHGPASRFQTSGSTGQPVAAYSTDITDMVWQAITLRDHLWHRRSMDGTLAAIRSFGPGKSMPPHGSKHNGWGISTDLLYPTGRSWMLNSNCAIDIQHDWLVDRNPDYLISHPSNIVALAECFQASGGKLPNLKEVRTVGETVSDRVRDACRQVWGCEVVDFYSCREVGYLALQCPDHPEPRYHVQSEHVYLEVVGEDGEPCEPGQAGKVLVTDLHNFAAPLIRYEVGDYAVLGKSCTCGRGLPVIERIFGRVRNMLHLPDGSTKWPHFGYRAFQQAAPVLQYQVIQHRRDKLEMKLVVTEPLSAAQEEKLREILADSLGYPFTVEFSYHDELPRTPGGKFEDFVCRL